MTERNIQSDIDAYENFVIGSRFENDLPLQETRHMLAGYINDEVVEASSQHGPGTALFMPRVFLEDPGVMYEIQKLPPDLSSKVADEFGDMTWFMFDVIAREGFRAQGKLQGSINVVDPDARIFDFESLDATVMNLAGSISVRGFFTGVPRKLAENPQLAYSRTADHLINALRSAKPDREEIASTAADMLIVLSYTAQDRLGTSIKNIAAFNRQKLTNRKKHGGDKRHDISFAKYQAGLRA